MSDLQELVLGAAALVGAAAQEAFDLLGFPGSGDWSSYMVEDALGWDGTEEGGTGSSWGRSEFRARVRRGEAGSPGKRVKQ